MAQPLPLPLLVAPAAAAIPPAARESFATWLKNRRRDMTCLRSDTLEDIGYSKAIAPLRGVQARHFLPDMNCVSARADAKATGHEA